MVWRAAAYVRVTFNNNNYKNIRPFWNLYIRLIFVSLSVYYSLKFGFLIFHFKMRISKMGGLRENFFINCLFKWIYKIGFCSFFSLLRLSSCNIILKRILLLKKRKRKRLGKIENKIIYKLKAVVSNPKQSKHSKSWNWY